MLCNYAHRLQDTHTSTYPPAFLIKVICVCLCEDAGGYVLVWVGGEYVLCLGEVEMGSCYVFMCECGNCGAHFVCLCDLYVAFVACLYMYAV